MGLRIRAFRTELLDFGGEVLALVQTGVSRRGDHMSGDVVWGNIPQQEANVHRAVVPQALGCQQPNQPSAKGPFVTL